MDTVSRALAQQEHQGRGDTTRGRPHVLLSWTFSSERPGVDDSRVDPGRGLAFDSEPRVLVEGGPEAAAPASFAPLTLAPPARAVTHIPQGAALTPLECPRTVAQNSLRRWRICLSTGRLARRRRQ